jgi:hypothetical protein
MPAEWGSSHTDNCLIHLAVIVAREDNEPLALAQQDFP